MEKRLERTNKSMIAGVCGGIGKYFNLDPTLIRIGYVLISFMGFPVLIYIILWAIMPQEPSLY
jgi:phage shock protein PspC (stress-responsive transcriptional regulator)